VRGAGRMLPVKLWAVGEDRGRRRPRHVPTHLPASGRRLQRPALHCPPAPLSACPPARLPACLLLCRSGGSTSRTTASSPLPWRQQGCKWRCVAAPPAAPLLPSHCCLPPRLTAGCSVLSRFLLSCCRHFPLLPLSHQPAPLLLPFLLQVHSHDYRAELPKGTWLGMMASKFWSTFSHCTQQELDQACAPSLPVLAK
jgi:hypothetical protein